MQSEPSLAPFFTPTGVVVVGASQDPNKLGFGLARNLLQSGYRGAVHFVNPRGGTLLEQPVWESVAAVPDPADLAVILIPAPAVPAALSACGERGIGAAIIASGGFRETGAEGAALEQECLAVARRYGMRLVGPNCIGFLDTHLPIDTTFLPPPGPTPGAVAFISHSGAICAAVIDWARGQGFGLSRLLSMGNQADVTETDVLAPVAADPYTRVITLYLEGVSDGRRFIEEARRVVEEKPIVALKVGLVAHAELQPETEATLRAALPPAASVHNPVDMLAGASPQDYATCLRALLDDPGVDSILVVVPPPPMHTTGAVARALIPLIYAAQKPVVAAVMGERLIQEAVEHFRAAHVPEYRFPERAASALAVLVQRAEWLSRPRSHPRQPVEVDFVAADELLAGASGLVAPAILSKLLAHYGIRVPAEGVATSAGEATALAKRIGFPVALKLLSPDIAHKSDVGGVLLNVHNAEEAAAGYTTLLRRAQEVEPQAAIDGVLVQEMVGDGQDVIVGAVRDPQFGPLLMFGSGGVEVEALRDVAFALAPITMREAEELLAETWAGRRLRGYRHVPPADQDAVLDAIHRLSQLVCNHAGLQEIEINPLRVLERGQGAIALDIRAVRTPS